MLTINCTKICGAEAKCALMIPKAGAIAAPAITVRIDIDNIVDVNSFEVFFIVFCYEH